MHVWALRLLCEASHPSRKIAMKTTCTLICQVSRFMCTVWVLNVTSSLVDVLLLGFTTRTKSKFSSCCSPTLSCHRHNYCLLHIAKTGNLRCCLHTPRRSQQTAVSCGRRSQGCSARWKTCSGKGEEGVTVRGVIKCGKNERHCPMRCIAYTSRRMTGV